MDASSTRSIIVSPLDPGHVRWTIVMNDGTQAAIEYFKVLYSHGLWLRKPCAAYLFEQGYRFQQAFARMANVSLHTWSFTGFAVKPKSHALAHCQVELKQQLLNPACRRCLSPLIYACEGNEDMVGKMSRVSRRVHQKMMAKRVLQLYMVKAKALYRRHMESKSQARPRR